MTAPTVDRRRPSRRRRSRRTDGEIEALAVEVSQVVREHFLATRTCVTGGEIEAARLAASIALRLGPDR